MDIPCPIGHRRVHSESRRVSHHDVTMRRDPTTNIDDLLTPEGTAALAGRSLAWLWRQAKAGRLKPVQLLGRTRFRRADVEALMQPTTSK